MARRRQGPALLCIGVSGGVALGLRESGISTLQSRHQPGGAYSGLPEGTSATRGMIFVTGGSFRMGPDKHFAEGRPQRGVSVDGFWIDSRAVTNVQFAAFVTATDYVPADIGGDTFHLRQGMLEEFLQSRAETIEPRLANRVCAAAGSSDIRPSSPSGTGIRDALATALRKSVDPNQRARTRPC